MQPASPAERERLNATFAALCAISSPFGRERACADWVQNELVGIGLEVVEDGAGAALGTDCGNLLIRLPGAPGARTVLLCAHLDTVPDSGSITPEVRDGAWVNAGPGILGADNKAAVAVLVELARRARTQPPPVGVELLFTVGEENALAGSKAVDVEALESEFGYVFDQSSAIGEVVVASPTYFRIAAEFRGRSAHAGVRPEDGRSAILAAADALARMPHGRIDPDTTANVAHIEAGTPASTNVVPDRCALLGEARSLDPGRAEETVTAMLDALGDGAAARECDVDVTLEKLFAGYRHRPSEPALRVAEDALRTAGYEPSRIVTGGGSDANTFIARGLTTVCLANGTERNHQPDESVPVQNLGAMLDVAFALLDVAGGKVKV